MARSSKKNPTPANKLIKAKLDRGRSLSNLWRCYSYKTNKDIVFLSHQELFHWLLNLEYDRSIKSFIIPREGIEICSFVLNEKTRPDAIVTKADDSIEWHEVKSGTIDKDNYQPKQLELQRSFAAQCGARWLIFDESDRAANLYKVMPLLRVSALIAAVRGEELPERLKEALTDYMIQKEQGCLVDILIEWPQVAPPIIGARCPIVCQGAG